MRWLMSAAVWLGLALWWTNPSLPPLVGNFPHAVSEADAEFKARVLSKFPPGSWEPDAIRELELEGFKVTSRVAVLDRPGLPCRRTWTVRWRASEGKLQAVEPLSKDTCL
jgi:hypothetical protein